MRYRPFGATGLEISEIGFGCGNSAGLMTGGVPQEQRKAVQRALDLGINYFDTAPNYGERRSGRGASEIRIGQTLRELGARPIVGTKVEFRPPDLGDISGTVARSVDESLARLGIDSIDVLYLHNRIAVQRALRDSPMGSQLTPGEVLGPGGVLEAFQRARDQGKVRFLGFCSGGGEAAATREVLESGGFDCVQLTYNVLNLTEGRPPPLGFQGPDHGQMIEHAAARNMGVVVIRVLAAGALSGRPERHPLNDGSRAGGDDYERDAQRAQALSSIADRHEQALSQIAIRFGLSHRGVSTVLVGFSEVAQVDEAIAAAESGPLPDADLSQIEALFHKY